MDSVSDNLAHFDSDGTFIPCERCAEMWAKRSLTNGLCPDCRQSDALADESRSAIVDQVPVKYRPALDIELPGAWDTETDWSVTFQGGNGTGKTWAATRTWSEVATPGSIWISGQEMAQRLRESVGSDYENPSEVMRPWVECPVLLVDDIKAARGTDFVADGFRYVLCRRYDWMRPTVLTTDLPLSDFEARLASRLYEGLVVKKGGRDRRRTA